MRKAPPKAIDYQALADFRFEIRRFLNFSERLAHAAGIEPQQHQALLVIKGLPTHRAATIRVLAERLLIQHHSAVELVNRLETKGLLRRTRGVADRREVALSLSRRGDTLLERLTGPHRAELQSAQDKLLTALAAAIDPHAIVVPASRNRQHKKQSRKRRVRNKPSKQRQRLS